MRALDVGIIGCGTAGSAAAVFLARAGHRVTLYERVPSPGPVGAGITLQPTGLHVVCRLGLYGHLVSRGARIDRLLCESKKRKSLVDLTYGDGGRGALRAIFKRMMTLSMLGVMDGFLGRTLTLRLPAPE